MILNIIYQGLVIVFLLTFSFGPAFFALINAGIKKGYKHGSLLALGIVLSDLFLSIGVCVLIYFGATKMLHSEKAQAISSVIGGVFLMIFGITYFIKKTKVSEDSSLVIETKVRPLILILKGFMLNLFTPAVWFLWLANATAVGHSLGYSLVKMILFFVVVLAVVLVIELGKVSLAGKIKHFLTDKTMHTVNYITGSALIVFGITLLYNHFSA